MATTLKKQIRRWAKKIGVTLATSEIERVTHYKESAATKLACGCYPSKIHPSAVEPLEKLISGEDENLPPAA